MSTTTWWPGRRSKIWLLYLVGGGLIGAAAYWQISTPTTTKMPSVISGQVSAPTGEPVAQARVYFLDGPEPLPEVAALTDTDGTFTLAAPAVGTYQLGCTADGFATDTLQAQVSASGQPVKVAFKLRR